MAQNPIGAQASRLARDLTLGGPTTTKIPKLIYGTAWKKDQTADLVYKALKNGFRGMDTAAQPKHYDEKAVGDGVRRAITEGLVRREDIFIQTKFTAPGGQNHLTPYDMDATLAEKVRQSLQSSIRNFAIEGEEPYLDSVVMHSPMDTMQDTLTVWRTLEEYAPHKVRNLGVSNIILQTLEALHSHVRLKPAVVQNRFHERTGYETLLRAFCRDNGIVFQSFWTMSANWPLVKSPPVKEIARGASVDMAPAYYALVLGLEGITVLNGTTNEQHMQEDLEGIEKIGVWAEGDGKHVWESALAGFKSLIKES